jgi:S-adenosylmethionine hydrolase
VADTLVTLTTDFGQGSCYVAGLKGAILQVNPAARLLDLSHAIPPQDLLFASFFLRAAVPFFPVGTLHLIVVDPGVGTDRAILYVELGGQRLLVPDNGCWTFVCEDLGAPTRVLRLSEQRYWRPQVSSTFHGRDIFAPTAGHLSLGLDPNKLGTIAPDWVELPIPRPRLAPTLLQGEVVYIDAFGNLLSNIPGQAFRKLAGPTVEVWAGDTRVPRIVRTYGDGEHGALVALVSSLDTLEIAVCRGSAAQCLGATVGISVTVRPGPCL